MRLYFVTGPFSLEGKRVLVLSRSRRASDVWFAGVAIFWPKGHIVYEKVKPPKRMSAMAKPVELFRDEFSTYYRDDMHKVIEQRWTSATKSMSEQQFREGVSRLAQLLQREHIHQVLVDVTEMKYRAADDFETWRQAEIIPKYNAAKVEKFAFLLPSEATATVENGTEPAREGVANFPTGYFTSRDRAFNWLAGS